MISEDANDHPCPKCGFAFWQTLDLRPDGLATGVCGAETNPSRRCGQVATWHFDRSFEHRLSHGRINSHVEWARSRSTTGVQLVLGAVNQPGFVFLSQLNDLAGAMLLGSRLPGAIFNGVRLDKAVLRNVDLSGSDLRSVSFFGATLDAVTLTDARLERASFNRATIKGCSFDDHTLVQTDWGRAEVNEVSFRNAQLATARLDGATFERCDFRGASFATSGPRLKMSKTQFIECDLRDTDWSNCDAREVRFERCRFDGSVGLPESSLQSLLAQVLARPRGLAPRRAWADAIERTDPWRANSVKDAVRMREHFREGKPTAAREWIVRREQPTDDTEVLLEVATRVKMAGGFPEGLTIETSAALEHLPRLMTLAPIRELELINAHGLISALAALPAFTRIEFLIIDEALTDEDLAALKASSVGSILICGAPFRPTDGKAPTLDDA